MIKFLKKWGKVLKVYFILCFFIIFIAVFTLYNQSQLQKLKLAELAALEEQIVVLPDKVINQLLDYSTLDFVHTTDNYTYIVINSDDFIHSITQSERSENTLPSILFNRLSYLGTITEHTNFIELETINHSFDLVFSPTSPKLAIIIDDMGENYNFLEELIQLPYKVTISIIPETQNANKTLDSALAHNFEVFLHQPMQAMSDTKVKRNFLNTEHTKEEIDEIITRNIVKLNGVTGLNNHTGSRFTSNAEQVNKLVEILKFHYPSMIIVDSKTIGNSYLYASCKQAGLTAYSRDIFLDNEQDVKLILEQLKKTEQVAKKNGQAIAIGHPHKTTLQALQLWNSSVKIVPVWQFKYVIGA